MPLKRAGRLRLSKSGKALEIIDEHRAVDYRFYAPLKQVKQVIEGKRVECDIALLVADNRENI